MSGKDDFDDGWRPYVQDPDDPSIQVDKQTLRNDLSTPEQCVLFVKTVQKVHRRRPGRAIYDLSIYGLTGWDTLQKLRDIVANNRESEWLKAAEKEYENLEYHLKEALKNFDKDTAPVVDALDAMIEWFMEFFVHRRQERWQMERLPDGEDPMEFWRRYFTVLKNMAIGFGKNPAHFDGFETSCNPFCIGIKNLFLVNTLSTCSRRHVQDGKVGRRTINDNRVACP